MKGMQWFGPDNGRAIAKELEPGPNAAGRVCLWCEEPVQAGDSGIWTWTIRTDDTGAPTPAYEPMHYECPFRSMAGSAGHILKECSCYGGGKRHDPPGMSKRDAARLALAAWDHESQAARL